MRKNKILLGGLILLSSLTIASRVSAAEDPTKKSTYETPDGWADWSQYAGSMKEAWGSDNYGCVTTSRVRAGARHGSPTLIPSKAPQVGQFSMPDSYTVLSGMSGPSNVSGSKEERIEQAIKVSKEEIAKGNEVNLRLGDGNSPYTDESGGSHTVSVDDVVDGKLFILDPGVGYGGNWDDSPASTWEITRIEIVQPRAGDRKNFETSAVRAQMGGNGKVESKGSGSSSVSSKKESSEESGDSTIHPLFNPFVPPMKATDNVSTKDANTGGDGSSLSLNKADGYNNLQRMNLANGFVEKAYEWVGLIAIISIYLLSAYMIVGLLVFLLDESVLGGSLAVAAGNVNGVGGKLVNPGGFLFGIKPVTSGGIVLSVASTVFRHVITIVILACIATGFSTILYSEMWGLIARLLRG